jgi:hypothetical protein
MFREKGGKRKERQWKKEEEKKEKTEEEASGPDCRSFCTCLEAEASCFTLVLADSGVPFIWSSMRRHHPAY